MTVIRNNSNSRQDPAIESYRLGLLADVQGLTQGQIFGQNVQDLRQQGLSEADIVARLNVAPTEQLVLRAKKVTLPELPLISVWSSGISQTAQFAPPRLPDRGP